MTFLQSLDIINHWIDSYVHKFPLRSLHSSETLIRSKLEAFNRKPNEELIASLKPGQPGSLKTRPDGTILDGHHRIAVLRSRGFEVDQLPREEIDKEVP